MQNGIETKFHIEDKSLWSGARLLELRAETHRDKVFLQFEDEESVTFLEMNERTNRVARGLASLGVSKGDTVLTMLPGSLENHYVWFATQKLGAVWVPVHTAYKGYFLEHVANVCKAKILVVDEQFLDRIAFSLPNLHYLEKTIVRTKQGFKGDAFGLEQKLQGVPFERLYEHSSSNVEVEINYLDPSAIMFTSGTTGASKGILLSQAYTHVISETVTNLLRLTEGDIFYISFPPYHGMGAQATVYPCLVMGAKAVIYEWFSASRWIDDVRKSGATAAALVGAMMDFVFRQPEKPTDSENNLRVIWAVPRPHAIYEAFKKRFHVEAILDSYAQTETNIVLISPYDEYRPNSAGKRISNLYELRVADPITDEELPPNQLGELLVRSKVPWAMSGGYFGMPEKTGECWRNGWWHTGDGLTVDEEGYYHFQDRLKDAIRRRGENISSQEIEGIINEHPAIEESAIVAVKAAHHGGEDEVKACIVLNAGYSVSPEELVQWCEGRIPYFAIPRYIEFIDQLPKTPTAKIRKQELREHGITQGTWDREKAGYKLKEEALKKKRKSANDT